MKKEFYLANLRNPEETIENGFQTFSNILVILEKIENKYKIYMTNQIFYPLEQTVIDGNQLYLTGSDVAGSIIKNISFDEAISFFTKMTIEEKKEYFDKIFDISFITTNFKKNKREEYLNTEQKFVKSFKR